MDVDEMPVIFVKGEAYVNRADLLARMNAPQPDTASLDFVDLIAPPIQPVTLTPEVAALSSAAGVSAAVLWDAAQGPDADGNVTVSASLIRAALRSTPAAPKEGPWPANTSQCSCCGARRDDLDPRPAPDTALDVERLREAVRHVMRDSTVRAGGPYASLTSTMYVVTLDREAYADAIVREYAALEAER